MGGGASKGNAAANNQNTTPSSASPPPSSNAATVVKDPPPPVVRASVIQPNQLIGPKNGELAPIPANAFHTKANTWNESAPLQPIAKGNRPTSSELTPIVPISTSPSASNADLNKVPSAIQSTKITSSHQSPSFNAAPKSLHQPLSQQPPQQLQPQQQAAAPQPTKQQAPPDQFKNKQFLERKLSADINSPIIRYKTSLHGEDKFKLSDDDQVVMNEDGDEEELYGDEVIDEPTMDFGGKSNADKFYEDLAEKGKKPTFGQAGAHSVQSIASMSSVGSASSLSPPMTVQMSEEEESGLYTEYGDYKATNILSQSKKIISVPTLKLADLGQQSRPKPVATTIVPAKSQEVPVVIKHGNFDNNKFRAANAKKKITDSIFQQTTYDYKAGSKNTAHSSSSSGPVSLRSSHDSVDTTSFGYSSDTSMDSPDVMRPPTTPTHKPAYDDFEETLISSILDDSKIESPA